MLYKKGLRSNSKPPAARVSHVYLLKPSRLKLRSHEVVVRERGSVSELGEAVRRSGSVQLPENSAVIRSLELPIAVFGGKLLLMAVLNVLRDLLTAVKAV
jgi:hypothetical protein